MATHLTGQEIKQGLDARYYYIRLRSLEIKQQGKDSSFDLRFQIGTKHSDTVINMRELIDGRPAKHNKVAHIIEYSGEQLLNVYLEERKGGKDKPKQKRDRVSGYARIPLVPIMELPHSRHILNLEIVHIRADLKEMMKLIAEMEIEVHFRMDFAASIEFIPISANLSHNVASVGDMKPIVKMTMDGNVGTCWSSLEAEGGIHPRWTGHFFARKDNGFIHARKQLHENHTLSWQGRQERMLSPTPQQRYFDCCSFRLISAGSWMQIQVYSYPAIGKEALTVGSTELRLLNAGFLKYPRGPKEEYFETKEVSLYWQESEGAERQVIGTIKMQVRLVFDDSWVEDDEDEEEFII